MCKFNSRSSRSELSTPPPPQLHPFFKIPIGSCNFSKIIFHSFIHMMMTDVSSFSFPSLQQLQKLSSFRSERSSNFILLLKNYIPILAKEEKLKEFYLPVRVAVSNGLKLCNDSIHLSFFYCQTVCLTQSKGK
jgi:hypothetical protein